MNTTLKAAESDSPQEAHKLETLIRYAILAPSSHNMQPWKFQVETNEIRLFADRTRWLEAADPDQRELHISLGCALENLLITATYFGYGYDVKYLPDPAQPELVAVVHFTGQSVSASLETRELFYAIPLRYTDRSAYSSRPIHPRDLEQILAYSRDKGVEFYMTDDPALKTKANTLMVRADAIQFANPAFRRELGKWIGEGVFGQPWLIAKLGQMAVTYLNLVDSSGSQTAETLMNAPVLAALCTRENDRVSQIKVGQVFERLALTAIMLNIGVQPMSQILQVSECKTEVSQLLPLNNLYPQFTFRLGYIEADKTSSPRRDVGEVLV